MYKNWILDLDINQYTEIRKLAETPKELYFDINHLQEYQQDFELLKFKASTKDNSQWILFVVFHFKEQILILSYYCRNLPSFMLSEIYDLVHGNAFQVQNNRHILNHILNQNGFKNYNQIVKDIFIQEMQFQIESADTSKENDRFKDYSFLFQNTLSIILRIQNSVSLADYRTKDLLFDFLNIEKSLRDLNSDYLTLYFLIQKKNSIIPEELVQIIPELMGFFQSKVEYHLGLLVRYLNDFVKVSKESDLVNTQINEDFQTVIIHLNNLNEFFSEIVRFTQKETELPAQVEDLEKTVKLEILEP